MRRIHRQWPLRLAIATLLASCSVPTSPISSGGTPQWGLPAPGAAPPVFYEITVPSGIQRPNAVITVRAQLVRGSEPIRAGGDTVTWFASPAHGQFARSFSVTDANGQAAVQFTFGSSGVDALQFKLVDQQGRRGQSPFVVSS